ncbi:cytochrome-c oxidases, partial [Striga asiatica]
TLQTLRNFHFIFQIYSFSFLALVIFLLSNSVSSFYAHYYSQIMQGLLFRMTETPFRPREKLLEKQKFFQNIHKHTYLKGPMDKITSVAIPLALAGSSLFLIVSSFSPLFSILCLYAHISFKNCS